MIIIARVRWMARLRRRPHKHLATTWPHDLSERSPLRPSMRHFSSSRDLSPPIVGLGAVGRGGDVVVHFSLLGDPFIAFSPPAMHAFNFDIALFLILFIAVL